MDRREDRLQALGICNRLHNFIKKALLMRALKTVILGDPFYRNCAKTHTKAADESDQTALPRAQEEKPREDAEAQAHGINNSDPSVLFGSSSKDIKGLDNDLPTAQDDTATKDKTEGEAPLPSLEAKPPKKSVSINDRVEEIDTRKQKTGRKKSKEKLTSFEQEEDEPKPLRSILKVGSYSSENSNSFINRTSDG